MTAEVLAASGFEGWAITGMLLFVFSFGLICLKTLLTPREEMARRARLPLSKEPCDD